VRFSLRLVALALCAASALLQGCAEEKPEAFLASAKGFLARQDAAAAVIQLKNALQRQPALAEARFLLGRALIETGDPVSAEIELRKALDLQYAETAVVPLLARSMVLQGKARRVIDDYATVELAEPAAIADLKCVLVTAYAQQGMPQKAREALIAALRASPDFAPALLMQVRAKAQEGALDEALALIERILAKTPHDYQALQLKGDLLRAGKGDAPAALEAQRKALAERKDWLPAHSTILEILLTSNDMAGAKAQLEALQKVLPTNPVTRYYVARLAFMSRDYKTARETVQTLLSAAPDNVNVLLLAGAIELEAGALPQAEAHAAKALQLAPDGTQARGLMAQIHLRSGQPTKAREILEPALRKPNVKAETLALAAQSALLTGDTRNAQALFDRAAKLNPADPRSRMGLALVQLSKGDAERGFDQLNEIAASDTGTVADMAIINARLRQKDYAGALKAIDALEKKQPEKPFAAHLRAQTQLAQNDFAAARQSFNRALVVDPRYFPATAGLVALDVRENKPEEARKRLDQVLARDPKNVYALLGVAELRAQAGASKEELATLLADAIKLNPSVAGPRQLLVNLLLREGDSKGAVAAAQDGVAALPDSAALWEGLGGAHLSSGSFDQALVAFKKAAALQPNSPEPHLKLADVYLAMRNNGAARESIQRALQISPKSLVAQRSLLALELAEGRADRATAIARQMQKDFPEDYLGYLLAGDIDNSRKNWDAAAASYRAGLKKAAYTELATKLHAVLSLGGKRGEADAFAAGWLKEHPLDAVFRTYLAEQALRREDFAAAEPHYLEIVKLNPKDALSFNNLAWVTHRLSKPGAAAYAERANALRPGQPPFMDTWGSILADAGDVKRALELQKKAVSLAPEDPALRLNLAKLYVKAGDKALAKSELDRLAQLGDKFAGRAEVARLLKTL
jgi:putative PEP-CTERM system TPR-repeat lipoprotein